MLRWGADETQLDGRGRSASDIAGALKNVFERGHRHAEEVERIRVLLANAPKDRRWIRRRAVVMLVSRLRGEIARGRSSREESNGAKKRGGAAATAAGGGEAAAEGGQLAAAAEQEEALRDAARGNDGGVRDFADGATDGEVASSLPHGMEAFRQVVFRLGGEDDMDIFRSVVGFL